ncbi:hypothetical protein GCM10011579_093770 [Streptomyces albiflavescens]|uniref:Uncharacterized protein n=1 Tax=Streptomyces albiflavescens TaxID=1623582 RepID=A0A917YGM5_9ACTN|nr:hypothetical protein GCM10011579_093770 [Streptomyces albiflavescens]
MALETTLRDPIQLTDPLSGDPEPTPGCDVCAALVKQWKSARNAKSLEYGLSRASDLIVELRRHQDTPGQKKARR